MPQLTHDASFKKNGVPELFSPEAVDFAWTQYQTLLIDKLNLLTQGTTTPRTRVDCPRCGQWRREGVVRLEY